MSTYATMEIIGRLKDCFDELSAEVAKPDYDLHHVVKLIMHARRLVRRIMPIDSVIMVPKHGIEFPIPVKMWFQNLLKQVVAIHNRKSHATSAINVYDYNLFWTRDDVELMIADIYMATRIVEAKHGSVQ